MTSPPVDQTVPSPIPPEAEEKVVEKVESKHEETSVSGEQVRPPEEKPKPEKPKPEKPKGEKTKTEKPKVEKPKVEKPKVEKPKPEPEKNEEYSFLEMETDAPPGGQTPIADKYVNLSPQPSQVFNVESVPVVQPVLVTTAAETAAIEEDTFDFSPPETLNLEDSKRYSTFPISVKSEKESPLGSPFSDGRSALPVRGWKGKSAQAIKTASLSSQSSAESLKQAAAADNDDDSGGGGGNTKWKRERHIFVAIIIAMASILVPVFVVMVYLLATRNLCNSQLTNLERHTSPHFPSGIGMTHGAMMPVLNYNRSDERLVSLLNEPLNRQYSGVSYVPQCNTPHMQMARDLAASSQITSKLVIDTSECPELQSQALSLMSDLPINMTASLTVIISENEEKSLGNMYEALHAVLAYPQYVDAILLEPVGNVAVGDIINYLIYMKHYFALYRQTVDVGVFLAPDRWTQELYELVDIVGVHFYPYYLGAKPDEASHLLANEILELYNELSTPAMVITGMGWPSASSSGSSNQNGDEIDAPYEFAKTWVCQDSPKLPQGIQWYYESAVDPALESNSTDSSEVPALDSQWGVFDSKYHLKYPITC